MYPGKVWVPQGISDAPYRWILLPGVPTPAKSTPLHTVVPAGTAEQTAWTPRASPLASVPARQVPGPQEPRLPPAIPQNVIVPRWCLAPLQLLPGVDPVGSSGFRSRRPVPGPRCLRSRRRVCSAHSPRFVCGGRGAERGAGGGGHGTGTESAVAALCWQRCAGPAVSLSPQGAVAVPTSSLLRPLTALNTGTALKPSQPFPSALTLSAPHFPTLDLLSVPTSFPRACPHIRFPRRSCHGLCHPSCHGHSTLAQAPMLPPALQALPPPHQCLAGCRQG